MLATYHTTHWGTLKDGTRVQRRMKQTRVLSAKRRKASAADVQAVLTRVRGGETLDEALVSVNIAKMALLSTMFGLVADSDFQPAAGEMPPLEADLPPSDED